MEDNPLEQNSYSLQKYSEAKVRIISSSTSLDKAIALMKKERISCLLIESQLKLTGILTERHLLELIGSGKDFSLLQVEQVMTRNPIVLNAETNLSSTEIASLFQRYHVHYLPLVNAEREGVGLITPNSILSNINFKEIGNAIDSLENESDQSKEKPYVRQAHLSNPIHSEKESFHSLEKDSKFLRAILQQMPGGVIVADASSGMCLLTNDLFTEIFRRAAAPINIFKDYLYFGLLEDDHSPSPLKNCPLVKALENNPILGEEMKFLCGDEITRTFLVNSAPIYNSQGIIVAAIATFYDINDIRQTRLVKQETAINENKGKFLKEIHHRIKNNLQVVSALLDLQSEQVQDEASHLLLEKSQARIQTMALIYEKLYSSNNIEQINFNDYVTALTRYLHDSFIEDYKYIELSLGIEPIELSIDLATPCGLIINEIVTNSLQHGFKNQDRGSIKINFFLDKNNQYNLQITDNGSGINPKIQIKDNPEFLGISMVESLVMEQLKGSWNISSENGCAIEITFPSNRVQ